MSGRRLVRIVPWFVALVWAAPFGSLAWGQSFGVEAHNTTMPASGGMGGVSIARPQDLVSAISANPATLTQYRGTQFTFAGSWAEATMNLTQTIPLPLTGVQPFSGKSQALGVLGGNIGVTQSLEMLGLPATFGLGFFTAAAGGADFRQFQESNGTNSALSVLQTASSFGINLTDRLSVGASAALGTAIFDGPFADIGGMTVDYGVRGTFGASYILDDFRNVGLYYQTKQAFTFDDAIRFQGPLNTSLDINMDLPENLGFGYADSSLMNGRLLIACDVLYKLWDNAALFSTEYDNQWVFQLGTQYDLGRIRLRSGYVYAENPLSDAPFGDVGGIIPPGGIPSLRYTQALLAVTSQHRISAGVGISDVLPNLDLDLAVGGMFRDHAEQGAFTSTNIESYWFAFGLTWRYGECCNSTCQTSCSARDAVPVNTMPVDAVPIVTGGSAQ